jgi:predicted DNA-binding transcriptional regulator AlpA
MRHKSGTKGGPQQTGPIPGTEESSPIENLPGQPSSARIDRLLTDFDLERLTQRARSTWQKARLTGTGPPFVRLGRLVRYRESDVEVWLATHPSLRSTSEIPERRITPEAYGRVVPASVGEAAECGQAIIKPQPRRHGHAHKQAA